MNIISDNKANRKIFTIALFIIGCSIITFFAIQLFSDWLALPPYSLEAEGKYVAFHLGIWRFMFIMPFGISFILAGYLMFHQWPQKIQTLIRAMSALLAIGGFGVTLLLFFVTIFRSLFPFLAITATTPFWLMAILATFAVTMQNEKELQ